MRLIFGPVANICISLITLIAIIYKYTVYQSPFNVNDRKQFYLLCACLLAVALYMTIHRYTKHGLQIFWLDIIIIAVSVAPVCVTCCTYVCCRTMTKSIFQKKNRFYANHSREYSHFSFKCIWCAKQNLCGFCSNLRNQQHSLST